MEIIVLNKKKNGKGVDGIPVDRGTPLGNKYRSKTMTREERIAAYRIWLWDQIKDRDPSKPAFVMFLKLACLLNEKGSLTLLCNCNPLPCHADVIAAALRWYLKTYMRVS